MGVLHKYMLCAFMVVFGLTFVHGYDLRTKRKFTILERKMETITMELQDVKADLRVEEEKSISLEIKLNELMDGKNKTAYDDKDSDLTEHHSVVHSQQEVGSVAMSVEQRINDAMKDEKNLRKQFEEQIKNDFMTANNHTEIKFTTLTETLSAVIDRQLDTIEDKVSASVTVLNEASSTMANLTLKLQHNDEAIISLMLESEQLNTTLLGHGSKLETIENDIANNVHQNDEYITNIKTKSDLLNTTLLRQGIKLETIENDNANNVQQNNEYITNLITASDQLNETVLRHGTKLETIKIDLANNVQQINEYITNLITASDKLNKTLWRLGTKLETIEIDIANNVQQNDEYITNLKTASEQLNKTFLRHVTKLKTIEIDLANNIQHNDEYMTNLKIESDKLNVTLLRYGTKLKIIKDDLANKVQQNDKSITDLSTESDQLNTTYLGHGAILFSLNNSLFDVRASVVELIDNCHRYKVCLHGGNHSVEGLCECAPPYYGNNCEKGCFNDGKYLDDGSCECSRLYVGAKCEKVYCFHGAKYSEEGTCECTLPYYGAHCEKEYTFDDCYDIIQTYADVPTGIYNITPRGLDQAIEVHCDMNTNGGGWTVFQYRFDGSLDFYRNFHAYENGFGSMAGEFWLGLRYIHAMTSSTPSLLRVDLEAADGATAYQQFDNFSLSEGPDYILHIGASSGTIGDGNWGLSRNKGSRFSTYDRDVDRWGGSNCAVDYHGAWWYDSCTFVNLNGEYAPPGTRSTIRNGYGGMVYYDFKNWVSLKTSKMMFRRK